MSLLEQNDWSLRSKSKLKKKAWARYGLSAFIHQSILHTIGGTNEKGEYVHDLLRFDLVTYTLNHLITATK
jgi:hypothetical protein